MLRYTTDRARPGLVALYDILPGNGAGQFLQPRSPHGAEVVMTSGAIRRAKIQSNHHHQKKPTSSIFTYKIKKNYNATDVRQHHHL